MQIPGWFATGINDAEKFLSELDLLEARQSKPRYGAFDRDQFDGYQTEYEYFTSQRMFDFLLTDGAIMQFKYSAEDEISYCFLESPTPRMSYAKYLEQLGLEEEECGDLFYSDYETAQDTEHLKKGVTPIRYDFSTSYTEGLHPASHLHIGYKSEIRLRINSVLKPFSFVLLVCRQCYPTAWLNALGSHRDQIEGQVRSTNTLHQRFFGPLDEHEYRLE